VNRTMKKGDRFDAYFTSHSRLKGIHSFFNVSMNCGDLSVLTKNLKTNFSTTWDLVNVAPSGQV
jgi:hypothetical protein